MRHEHADSLAAAAAKLSPTGAVIGATLFGFQLQEWVYALTIVYTFLLIVGKLHDFWGRWKSRE